MPSHTTNGAAYEKWTAYEYILKLVLVAIDDMEPDLQTPGGPKDRKAKGQLGIRINAWRTK